jgi:hypothetical protein
LNSYITRMVLLFFLLLYFRLGFQTFQEAYNVQEGTEDGFVLSGIEKTC